MSDLAERPQHAVAAPSSIPKAKKPALPVSSDQMDQWRLEEPRLIRAWQDDADSGALETLLTRYKRFFSRQVSKILAGRAVSDAHRKDLEQEAMLAFITAVTNFSFDVGTRLSTYAQSHVRAALLRYTLDNRNAFRIGTGSSERKAYYRALAMRSSRITSGKSEMLTDEDVQQIQKTTGASERATKRAVDAIYSSQTGLEAAEEIACDSSADGAGDTDLSVCSAMDILAPFVEGLDDRKQVIFSQLCGRIPDSNTELSDRFGVTVERVGQLRRELLKELRDTLEDAGISATDIF